MSPGSSSKQNCWKQEKSDPVVDRRNENIYLPDSNPIPQPTHQTYPGHGPIQVIPGHQGARGGVTNSESEPGQGGQLGGGDANVDLGEDGWAVEHQGVVPTEGEADKDDGEQEHGEAESS